MRLPLLVLISWLVVQSASVFSADTAIPQDPARMERRSKEWLAWNRQTLGDAYKKIGRKDPRWDKPALEALDLAARMFSMQDNPNIRFEDIYQPSRQAINAGCDDPLILYMYSQVSVPPNYPGNDEYVRRVQKASDAMLVSSYSPFRRASALLKATQNQGKRAARVTSPDQVQTIEAGLDGIFDLLGKSVDDDPRGEFWDARWYDNIRNVLIQYRRIVPGADSKKTYDQFEAKLAKIPGTEALKLAIRGRFFMDWGWEARTLAFAPAVSEKQFQTFEQRLTEARVALEAAYKINPNQPVIAGIMLDIEKAIGQGDRDAMELWFRRAMLVDPNDRAACWSKLDWLDPKWHGDNDGKEMLAFGKDCAATNNWKTGIILLAADAIYRHGETLPLSDRGKYRSLPENWNPIQSVYDEYLKHYPTDNNARSKYAMFSAWAGRYSISHTQFQAVGDQLTQWSEFPFVPLEAMKQRRDAVAKEVEKQSNKIQDVKARAGTASTPK